MQRIIRSMQAKYLQSSPELVEDVLSAKEIQFRNRR